MHLSILNCLIRTLAVLALAVSSFAKAESQLPVGAPAQVSSFNPVTFLREAIAALKTIALAPDASTYPTPADLSIDFARGNEHERVSLVLSESQLRVRLGRELQLQCEVSSHDVLDAEPELGLDLALQFKFK